MRNISRTQGLLGFGACTALLVMAGIRGLQAGGILVSDGNPTKGEVEYNPHRSIVEEGVGKSIEVALGAIERLARTV